MSSESQSPSFFDSTEALLDPANERRAMRHGPHVRVRWVMAIMLGVLAVLVTIGFLVNYDTDEDLHLEVSLMQVIADRMQLLGEQDKHLQAYLETGDASDQQALVQSVRQATVLNDNFAGLYAQWQLRSLKNQGTPLQDYFDQWRASEVEMVNFLLDMPPPVASTTKPPRVMVAKLDWLHEQLLLVSNTLGDIQRHLLSRMHTLRERSKNFGILWYTLIVAVLMLMLLLVVEHTVRVIKRQYRTERAQTERLRRFVMVAEMSSSAMVLTDANHRVMWANKAYGRMLDAQVQSIIGRRAEALLRRARVDERALRHLRLAVLAGVAHKQELFLHGANGKRRWFQIETKPLVNEERTVIGAVMVAQEMTELRQQAHMLRLAIDGAGVGIWDWEINTDWTRCNERFMELMGFGSNVSMMRGREWQQRVHPDDRPIWREFIIGLLRVTGGSNRTVVRLQQVNGRWIWLLIAGTVSERDSKGHALRMTGVVMDVNAQKAMELQLRNAARTDELTQLPNRSVVQEKIETALARRRQQPGYNFAVLFMDFDRFKQVNDTLGHGVGDELLRQIARRLQDTLRPGDTLVHTSDFDLLAARIGGDEFVVVLDDIRGDLDAEIVAGRLLDVLAVPYQVGNHRVDSTVSIGIVTSTFAADDADSVLRDADIAMYEAKRSGRARYVMFEPAMRDRVSAAVALESDLRQALAAKGLHVVYQPIIDLRTQRLMGVEALARWRHPVRGMVSPADFVPMAEASGLIDTLGQFVLQQSCTDFERWQAELGPLAPRSVSVNLSRAQLRHPHLVAMVHDTLRNHSMRPSNLILEVTESLAAQDEQVQGTLHAIRELGVELSLDDFGTGYSSLACLHELPIQHLKIDRSFVALSNPSRYHRVLVESTVEVGHALGLQVVAEGIETEEQMQHMQRIGCDKGQGYWFAKPMETTHLLSWIREREVPLEVE
ncbi:EAL domain-containing protein [Curvibacter sp. CHRR-16]|uniref:putative bifunctional diguanylate cyclase/phosphodiesterase n=1 Tax=Curvibacter sp. CHRR-16 TaxID=2835872 RepID=UPI001BD990D9|nr:EAL domain-containing protein [Curvibacter sp. CHRR-16]MBT0570592.1 EAL domain-containing protein [Curvibacter sp. CHRR-16]